RQRGGSETRGLLWGAASSGERYRPAGHCRIRLHIAGSSDNPADERESRNPKHADNSGALSQGNPSERPFDHHRSSSVVGQGYGRSPCRVIQQLKATRVTPILLINHLFIENCNSHLPDYVIHCLLITSIYNVTFLLV